MVGTLETAHGAHLVSKVSREPFVVYLRNELDALTARVQLISYLYYLLRGILSY